MARLERKHSSYAQFDDHCENNGRKTNSIGHGGEEDWEELHDDKSGHAYWFNHATGETTWDPPDGFETSEHIDVERLQSLRVSKGAPRPPPDELSSQSEASTSVHPTSIMPSIPPQQFRAVAEFSMPVAPQLPQLPALPAPPPQFAPPPAAAQATLPPGWEAHEDDESGEIYFFNVNTGETTWEAPQ